MTERKVRSLAEKEAKLAKDEAKLAQRRVRLSVRRESHIRQERKQESRLKYEIGGLAVMTGADRFGKATIAGMFQWFANPEFQNDEMKETYEAQMEFFHILGEARLQEAERKRQEKADQKRRDNPPVAVEVEFETAPDNETRGHLKGLRLTYDQERRLWFGPVPKKRLIILFEKVVAAGGEVYAPKEIVEELGLAPPPNS